MIPAISSAIHALGPQASIGSVGTAAANNLTPAAAGVDAAGATTAAPATGSGSFGNALTSAINSLDQTQKTATTAAQGLATGTLTDPTQAVTAVENASMAMDFASQIRDKLDTAANTLFATQM